jgi:hypothetical protein
MDIFKAEDTRRGQVPRTSVVPPEIEFLWHNRGQKSSGRLIYGMPVSDEFPRRVGNTPLYGLYEYVRRQRVWFWSEIGYGLRTLS